MSLPRNTTLAYSSTKLLKLLMLFLKTHDFVTMITLYFQGLTFSTICKFLFCIFYICFYICILTWTVQKVARVKYNQPPNYYQIIKCFAVQLCKSWRQYETIWSWSNTEGLRRKCHNIQNPLHEIKLSARN